MQGHLHKEQMSVLFLDYSPSIRSSDTICSQKKKAAVSLAQVALTSRCSLFYNFVIGSHLNLKKSVLCNAVSSSCSSLSPEAQTLYRFVLDLCSVHFFSLSSTSGINRTQRDKNNPTKPSSYQLLMCIFL